jgi:hypothetical protein
LPGKQGFRFRFCCSSRCFQLGCKGQLKRRSYYRFWK